MPESTTHKRAKSKATGKSGRTEVHISRNRRLDAATNTKAIEVETSGRSARLEQAARRLKASGKRAHILVVPQKHMQMARDAMRSADTVGTVRNLSGTKKSRVGSASKAKRSTRAGKSARRR